MKELTRITDEEIKDVCRECSVPEDVIENYGIFKERRVAAAQLAHSKKEHEDILRAIGEWLEGLDGIAISRGQDEVTIALRPGYAFRTMPLSDILALKQGKLPEGMVK